MLKSSTANLKCVQNIKLICVNFSSLHQKAKTELWVSLTFGLWAVAATIHLIQNYGRQNETLSEIIQIVLASCFAAGFGWHLRTYAALHRMEKRGQDSSVKEFGTI